MQALATWAGGTVGEGSLWKGVEVPRAVVSSLLLALFLVVASPASAGPGSNPNAEFIADLVCEEVVSTQEKVTCQRCRNSWDAPVNNTKNVANQSYPLAPAFVLAAGETRTFEGTLQVPGGSPPSFTGPSVRYEWKIRGRLEAFGNDPDSGFQSLRVGTR